MGELIMLSDHRRARESARAASVTFSFDLASPHTYLAAERVDRLFAEVWWRPVITSLPGSVPMDERIELRAAALRLPLVWPESDLRPPVAARRVAAYAAGIGQAPAFVLAASRLSFCGGFDINDPEILAEAAAAANLPLDAALSAAADKSLDDEMYAGGDWLVAHGADCLPVLQVGKAMFCGEGRIAEAAAASRAIAPAVTQAFNPA